MDLLQLKQIQQALETFFYKARLNIAVHNIIRNSTYSEFRKQTEDALYTQISNFATVEQINRILGLQKAVGVLTELDLIENLDLLWVPILSILGEDEMNSYLKWVAQKSGQASLNKLQPGITFSLQDQGLLRSIDIHGEQVLSLIDDTTKSWIARTVEQGIKNGMSNVEIAKLLRDNAKRVATERADVVAEHEAVSILGLIQLEVFKRNGVSNHKWISSRDEAVCEYCAANEQAGIVRLGDLFPSGAVAPPQHQRCRCIDVPVIPKDLKVIWTG